MARGWGTNLDYKNVGENMKLLDFNIQLFAGGTIDLGASGNLQGRIVWTATSNGSASNSSNGSANLQIRKDPSTTVATKGTFSFKLQAFGKTTESTWYGSLGTGWVTIASISNVVSHNADGTGTAYIYGKATGPSGTSLAGLSVSGSKNVTLDKIARQATITSAPDFNDEENPTITYNNPAGNSVSELEASISLTGATDDITYRPISKTESSYTFELTDEERELLRVNAKSNNLPLWFYIKTKIGNDTFYSKISKTMTIINGNPIFSDFVFEDVNEKTLSLTGNNQNIIRGYSNVKVTIPAINKAVAVKQATMTKYRFNCNGSSVDINYSSDADVEGILNNITSGIFDVYAVDSRNNSTLVTKNANSIIEYTPLIKGAMSVGRDNGVSQDVILKVSGRLDLANFGNVINSIKESKYRYKITNTNEWVEYQDLELTIEEDGTFSFEGLIKGDTEELGFDIANSYQVEVLIKDELSQIVFSATFGSGIPNIALSKNGVGVMGAYDEKVGGLFQIGGKKVNIPEVLNKYSDSQTDVYSCDYTNKLKIEHLAGIYTVLSLPVSGSTTGDVNIGTCYRCKDRLLELCPLKSGYKRTYKAVTYANTGRNLVVVYLGGNEIGNFAVWGSNKGTTTEAQIKDITEIINSLPTGHAEIDINNTYDGTGSNFYYINRIEIWAYDTLEDEVVEETTTN